MIEGRRALEAALDLAQMPTLAPAMRAQPLPPDTLVVIRIAAGCAATCREAVELTGKQAGTIREAAVLYLQQVLFAPGSESHRVLGVSPDAPRRVMREHLRWLIRWLHPDRNPNEWENVFAERVIKAWRDAGSSSRAPVAVAGSRPAPRAGRDWRIARQRRIRWIAVPIDQSDDQRRRGRRRIAAALVVGVLGLALVLLPAQVPLLEWLGIAGVDAQASAENAE